MSGRIYDHSGKATCMKCGSDMFLSSERNFNGPMCKNKKCDGSLLDAKYDETVAYPGTFCGEIKLLKDKIGEKKA